MRPFGLILMGGASRRMGQDKGALTTAGETWADHALRIVSPFVQDVFVSVKKSSTHPLALHDEIENIGPAAGLIRAHHEKPQHSWLIFAVDFPYATDESIRCLVDKAAHERTEITCYQNEEQFGEPLFAVWTWRALKALEQNVAKGLQGPMATLKQVGCSMIIAPDAKWIQNVNTPEQFAQAQQLVKTKIPNPT